MTLGRNSSPNSKIPALLNTLLLSDEILISGDNNSNEETKIGLERRHSNLTSGHNE